MRQHKSTLAREFNHVTIFNNMVGIKTERGKFTFTKRDTEVAWAKDHGLKMKPCTTRAT